MKLYIDAPADDIFYIWVAPCTPALCIPTYHNKQWSITVPTTQAQLTLVFYRWCNATETASRGELPKAMFMHQGVVCLSYKQAAPPLHCQPASIYPRKKNGVYASSWDTAESITYPYRIHIPGHWIQTPLCAPEMSHILKWWQRLQDSPPINGTTDFKMFLRLFQKEYHCPVVTTSTQGIAMLTQTTISPACWTKHMLLASAILGKDLTTIVDNVVVMNSIIQLTLGSIGYDSCYTMENIDDEAPCWASMNLGRDCEDKVIAAYGVASHVLSTDFDVDALTDVSVRSITLYLRRTYRTPMMLGLWLVPKTPHAALALYSDTTAPLLVETTAPNCPTQHKEYPWQITATDLYHAIATGFTSSSAWAFCHHTTATVGITLDAFYTNHYQKCYPPATTVPNTMPIPRLQLGDKEHDTLVKVLRQTTKQISLEHLKHVPHTTFPVTQPQIFVPLDSITEKHLAMSNATLFVNTENHSGLLIPNL